MEQIIPDDITNLVAKRDALRNKVASAKIASATIKSHLEETRRNLQNEQHTHTNLKTLGDNLMTSQLDHGLRCYSENNSFNKKSMVIAQVEKLTEAIRQNAVTKDTNAMEQQATAFMQYVRNSPWIPQKHQLITELESQKRHLEVVRNEERSLVEKIKTQNELINGHNKYPFRNFCITMANNTMKMSHLDRLMAKEIHLNIEYKEKLKKMHSDEDLDITMDDHVSNDPVILQINNDNDITMDDHVSNDPVILQINNDNAVTDATSVGGFEEHRSESQIVSERLAEQNVSQNINGEDPQDLYIVDEDDELLRENDRSIESGPMFGGMNILDESGGGNNNNDSVGGFCFDFFNTPGRNASGDMNLFGSQDASTSGGTNSPFNFKFD